MRIADRVKVVSTSTGTADFALGSAVPKYRTFVAGLSVDDYVYYLIEHEDGVTWELGYATTGSNRTVLQRTASSVIANSAGTTARIDFAAGNKTVSLVASAYTSIACHYNSLYPPPVAMTAGLAAGGGASALGLAAIALGRDASVGTSASESIAIGDGVTANNPNGICMGQGGTVNKDNAMLFGFKGALSSLVSLFPGSRTWHQSSAPGSKVMNRIEAELYAETTSATPVNLAAGVAGGAITLDSTSYMSTMVFDLLAWAVRPSDRASWAKRYTGLLKWNATPLPELVGAPVAAAIANDSALAALSVSASVGTNALVLACNGLAGETIRWGGLLTLGRLQP